MTIHYAVQTARSRLLDRPSYRAQVQRIDPRELARWARVVSANRLINLGADLRNTGDGGSRFGGDFCTPIDRLLAAFDSTPHIGGAVPRSDSIPLFVELCAGLASVSLMLEGGEHARPPVSRMGSKRGYALAILRCLGLRPGQGAHQYLWCEPDEGVRLLLEAYRDPELARAAADIIRGWADEDPRELWERLRAEGPVKGVTAREVGRWTYTKGRQINGADGGFKGTRSVGVEKSNSRTVSAADALAIGADIRRAREAAGLSRAAVDRALGLNTACSWWEGRNFKGRMVTRPPSLPVWRNLVTLLPALDAKWTDVLTPTPGAWESSLPGVLEFGDRLREQPSAPATIAPDARDVDPAGVPAGTVVFCDPPYVGTTKYQHDLPRDEVCTMAERWASAGALVCISEAEPIEELGWHSVEITSQRAGQKRTFSRQQREWLTMSAPPAWKPAVQTTMFAP